jgi:peptide/nickel transport system substrate-binding protein
MLSRRSFNRAIAAGAAAAALPVSAQRVLGAGAGTTLKFIPQADLKNIDPIWTTAYITRNHGYLVYDTLFSMDAKLQVRPQMVEHHEVSKDGLTYTFQLRDGLKWHDGTPVTAKDCVASVVRWGKRDAEGQKLMSVVAKMAAKDAKTFQIVLQRPYGLVLASLGKIDSNVPFMMPERLAQTDPFKQVPEVIGSGPFKFAKAEWVPGAKVVYLKNEDYVPRKEPPSGLAGGKVVHVDRVEWDYIPDTQTAMNALNSGEVDGWEQVTAELVPLLQKNKDVRVEVLDPIGNQGWLRPNHLFPPFDNEKARQALLHMVDQKQYMEAAIGEGPYWRSCPAWFFCGTPNGTDVGAVPIKQDLGLAKKLLTESGYKGEPIIVMDPTDIAILHRVTLVTAQLLRQIGGNVVVQAMDWSTLTSRRAQKDPPNKGGWNIFHTYSAGVGNDDPVANAGVASNCDKAWFGWPCDKKVEELRDAYAFATDPKKQKEIVVELQKYLNVFVPYVNYGQFFIPTGFRNNIKGVIKSPIPVFWNITKT